jgi:hypothetical protein
MKIRLIDLIPISFFVGFLSIGMLIYKDYGIPYDEESDIHIGTINYQYVFHNNPAMLTEENRYYGVLFEMPLYWLSNRFTIPRHFLIFLIFFAGSVIFFFLASHLLKNRWGGLLATAMLVTSPRIFADAFYNDKDIPFLVVTVLAIWTLILLLGTVKKYHGWISASILLSLHSIASAAMISTRIPGLIIIPISLMVLIISFFKSPSSWLKILAMLVGYMILTTIFTVLFWPVLWHDPLGEFINAFNVMSKYPWEGTVLFMGRVISAAKLPWHYLPVWIGITTPLMVLVGFVPGVCTWIKSILNGFKHRRLNESSTHEPTDSKTLEWTIVVAWLSVPIMAVFIFHSVLYDGWRHMFFIYPAIILISLLGLRAIYNWLFHLVPNKFVLNVCTGLFLLLGLAEPILFMARYHPHENVYFNVLAGNPNTLRERFEMDYWGLSYKQAIDYILANDPSPEIKIFSQNSPGYSYMRYGLPIAQRDRLVRVNNPDEANYLVSNYRWHPEDYPYKDKFYSIRVRGTEIMVVYRIQ